LFDYVLANSNVQLPLPEYWHSEPVQVDDLTLDGAHVITADVVSVENRYHHDPKKLADALMRLYFQRPEMEVVAEEARQESAVVM
jgi:hypothetical protein